MLNDLLAFERGLSAINMHSVARHPDIKEMAKGTVLRVRLDADAGLDSIEIVEGSGRPALWTLRDGQQNGFPGIKTAMGLLAMNKVEIESHKTRWEKDKSPISRRAELLCIVKSYKFYEAQIKAWPKQGHRDRIKERKSQLEPLLADSSTKSVPIAFERFLTCLEGTPPFLRLFFDQILDHIQNSGDEWLDPAREALISPVALVIDVASAEFDRDAGDQRQIGPITRALATKTENTGRCALTGNPAALHTGNFPQPNLPVLGQTYVFARNRDIPSLSRYRRFAHDSFAVDADIVNQLSGILAILTSSEVKGRLWRDIPDETGDKQDLLITGMFALPDIKLAEALAVDGDAIFKELASRVLAQSQGKLEHDYAQSEVILLILRTLDPANRKAIYNRRTTAGLINESARRWQMAIVNTPPWIGFRVPVKAVEKKGSGLVFLHPPNVAPLSITKLSRTLFIRGGQGRVSVIGVTAASAFELFLRSGDVRSRAQILLNTLYARHRTLLSGLADAQRKGIDFLKNFDPQTDLRRDALRSLTWLGALLHYLDRCKECYMSEAAFRLGQFLAVADVVHIGYCTDLRDGQVPPTLLGNSVFAIAGSNPERALAILSGRWKPYGSWLKRSDVIYSKIRKLDNESQKLENEGRKVDSEIEKSQAIALRRAISQARRASSSAEELKVELRDYMADGRKLDDVFKTELLLGYVAGLPREEKDGGSDSTTAQSAV